MTKLAFKLALLVFISHTASHATPLIPVALVTKEPKSLENIDNSLQNSFATNTAHTSYLKLLCLIGKSDESTYPPDSDIKTKHSQQSYLHGFIDLSTFEKLEKNQKTPDNILLLDCYIELTPAEKPIAISLEQSRRLIALNLTEIEKNKFDKELREYLNWCLSISTTNPKLIPNPGKADPPVYNFHELNCSKYTNERQKCSRCKTRELLGHEEMRGISVNFFEKTSRELSLED